MEEGPPIAYQLLDEGVPVLSADGVQVGTVASVVAAEEKDIFHGLLISTSHGIRFVEADEIAELHERGVDLRIDSAAAASLPGPEHRAPVYGENPAGEGGWHHWWNRISAGSDWHKNPRG